MAVPYFNAHSLNPIAQKAYDPAVSNSGSVLDDCPQRPGVVFGLEVQQAAPNNYLNTSNPYGESFHNPFNDYRFPKVLVRVLYHQEPGQSEPLGLSNKTKAQQSDENILYTSQSGLGIDQVWSMAVKANSQSCCINANHSPLDSTLKDTAGNGSSSMGQSTPQISSVVDNTSQKQSEKRKASRKAYEQSEKRKASRKAYRQSDKGRASRKAYEQSEQRKAYQKAYRESDKGRASRKAYEQSEKRKASRKAYRQSDKGQASRKAYQQSEQRKAYQKAYRQSDKGQASRKTYEQSEQRKASRKAYEQSEQRKASRKAYEQSEQRKASRKAYQKAYREVFNKTGDKEQAKIAGKQASALIKKSNKTKKSELESISISPLTPPPLRLTGKSIIEG